MLRFDHIDFSYDTKNAGSYALRDISFELLASEHVCVVGSNGSGKSTLLRLANQTLKPSAGSICLNGRNFEDLPSSEIKQRVGLVRQDPTTQLVSSVVFDELAFGPRNLGLPHDEVRRRTSEALHKVGLDGFEQRLTHDLSGGEQQRLALAGVMVMRPQVLLLDEVDSQLDQAARKAVRKHIKALVDSGVAVLEATHDAGALQDATRVLVLEQGRLLWSGAPEVLLSSDELMLRSGLIARHAPEQSSVEKIVLGEKISPGEKIVLGEKNTSKATSPDSQQSVVLHAEKLGVVCNTSSGTYKSQSALTQQSAHRKVLIDDISLDLHAGELMLVSGKSGAGKTTLALLLAGLMKPSSGKVLYEDQPVRPSQVGFVFQRTADQLFCDTVLDDVMFGPLQQGLSAVQARLQATAALRTLGVSEELFDRSVFSLSGGQARRVAIAGVLSMQAHVLIFDEPTCGLDAQGRYELRTLVAQLCRRGCAVLIITHDAEDWMDLASSYLRLDEGHVVERECAAEKGRVAEKICVSARDRAVEKSRAVAQGHVRGEGCER